jgi:phosphoglycerate dehydrogenase-like enzyme
MDANVLVTLRTGLRETLFDDDTRERLEALGTVTWNPGEEQFTPGELRERLRGVDVLVTGWGTQTLDGAVLEGADDLELVAHVGGSVASVASPALYDRGVTVTSANREMARYVAEAVLAMALTSLRDLPAVDREVRAGEWSSDRGRFESLFGADVGFVGLGTVGRDLLDLFDPFDVSVTVYDPYVDAGEPALDRPWVELGDLEAALDADVVSIHASLTEETLGLLDADRLAAMPDGALIVNCARGPIVDEDALADELAAGRLRAALDVFDEEPLPADHPFHEHATLLTPHVAGAPGSDELAATVVSEVERFLAGEPLEGAVSRERFELMTRDGLRGGN